MSKSLLVSNVLPGEALALIPKEFSVDYHDSQDVLPRPELISRLRAATADIAWAVRGLGADQIALVGDELTGRVIWLRLEAAVDLVKGPHRAGAWRLPRRTGAG